MSESIKRFEAAVVGAGPGGTACAAELVKLGVKTVLLDRADFPRLKLCAGWITPEVMSDLGFAESDYPYGITRFDRITFHISKADIPVRTRQYSIRRYEFDHWLLSRVRAPFYKHTVRRIRRENGEYDIDGRFRARYLIGAGGTGCPVYRNLFKKQSPRSEKHLVVTMEKEYKTEFTDAGCHLWFFLNGLPGYGWYVPKQNGYLNIGIGGKAHRLNKKGRSIQQHFDSFAGMLEANGLVRNRPDRVKGYAYYLRNPSVRTRTGKAFLIGDAAGIATKDMGEGIGPAVKSGILAARSIAYNRPFELKEVNRFSLPELVLSGLCSC
ncbi:MAG: NAD(P)/FAD-dependent oxidoreductase [Desulfobacteraceae bacterium]